VVGAIVGHHRPKVIGKLPLEDIREIRQVVWRELKEWEYPRVDRDSVWHLGYVVRGLYRYNAVQILWIEVKDDRYVRVVAGFGINSIASDGWDFMVRKSSRWEITGSAYWGSPDVAPKDFRIPPYLSPTHAEHR